MQFAFVLGLPNANVVVCARMFGGVGYEWLCVCVRACVRACARVCVRAYFCFIGYLYLRVCFCLRLYLSLHVKLGVDKDVMRLQRLN